MTRHLEGIVVLLAFVLAGCARSGVSDVRIQENAFRDQASFQVEVTQEVSCHASQTQLQKLRTLIESDLETLGYRKVDGKGDLLLRVRLTEFAGDVETGRFLLGLWFGPTVARYRAALENVNKEFGSFHGACADLSEGLGFSFSIGTKERDRLIEACAEQVTRFVKEKGLFPGAPSSVSERGE